MIDPFGGGGFGGGGGYGSLASLGSNFIGSKLGVQPNMLGTVGGIAGSMFGPFGSFAGNFLGNALGGVFGMNPKPPPRTQAELSFSLDDPTKFNWVRKDTINKDIKNFLTQYGTGLSSGVDQYLNSIGIADPYYDTFNIGTRGGQASFGLPQLGESARYQMGKGDGWDSRGVLGRTVGSGRDDGKYSFPKENKFADLANMAAYDLIRRNIEYQMGQDPSFQVSDDIKTQFGIGGDPLYSGRVKPGDSRVLETMQKFGITDPNWMQPGTGTAQYGYGGAYPDFKLADIMQQGQAGMSPGMPQSSQYPNNLQAMWQQYQQRLGMPNAGTWASTPSYYG